MLDLFNCLFSARDGPDDDALDAPESTAGDVDPGDETVLVCVGVDASDDDTPFPRTPCMRRILLIPRMDCVRRPSDEDIPLE